MVRHIVAWNFVDGLTEEEKAKHAEKIKRIGKPKNILEDRIHGCIDQVYRYIRCGSDVG